MHPLLVGGNPFTTTSIYGLILFLEKKWGIHYSMGGTGNIIKGYEKLMNEVGIKDFKRIARLLRYFQIIIRLLVFKSIIKTDMDTDNMICNADPPAVYERLLGQQ